MYIMYTTHILAHLIWIRCLLFTKATTNFSVFHLNICSLAKNFYKLQDFVSMLNKAPSCIAIIVDLPFRITTCRFLLAIVFRTWGLVCINLSFASREFVCARSTAFAHDLDSHCIRFCPSAWAPRFQRVELCIASARTTLAVSAVAPSKSFSAAANQKPFVNKDLCTRKSVKRTIKWWEPNALLRLSNLKCQAVLVGS